MPIYYGYPNIKNFFPANSLIVIGIDDPASSIERIAGTVEHEHFSHCLPHVNIAREMILKQYTIFNVMSECAAKNTALESSLITLSPQQTYKPSPLSRAIIKLKLNSKSCYQAKTKNIYTEKLGTIIRPNDYASTDPKMKQIILEDHHPQRGF